jgi:hypothetical protein
MNEENMYTENEILERIKKLNDSIDIMKRERLSISRKVKELNEQVDYWECLSLAQTKLF